VAKKPYTSLELRSWLAHEIAAERLEQRPR
jgi:hypothetical protein